MTTLTLPADLGIEFAATLKETLAPLLEQEGELVIDGSQASRLHCASLQLLATFFQSRHSQQLTTRLQASAALEQAVNLLGLKDTLSDEPQASLPHALNQEKSA